jgi:PAT family beta-lactamase induction signal transducer AmpG
MSQQNNFWKSLSSRPMLTTLLMGFSSGLPLLLTLRTLQAWMADVGVDLKTIGIFSLVGLPYSLKFLWSPLFDRYKILGLGRRRGWLLVSPVGLVISIAGMGFIDPKANPVTMAFFALFVSFCSASQDIVIDAYRRETLEDNQLGLGSTFYLYGYRIAMWITGAMAIGLAAFISWEKVYWVMAGIVLLGIATTIWLLQRHSEKQSLIHSKIFYLEMEHSQF